MIRLFDFRCESTGKVFERMARGLPDGVQCNCGANAKRLISPVKCQLDPFSGHFPGATDKWAKAHEDGAKNQSS